MPSSAQPIVPCPRPLRILYVEDEPQLRTVVASFLRRHGHTVETAGDGAEGLLKISTSMMERRSYDLVVTDIRMPVLDGLELIRTLRQTRLRARVIVHSSELTAECMDELASLAIDGTVPKGTHPELLAETIAKLEL